MGMPIIDWKIFTAKATKMLLTRNSAILMISLPVYLLFESECSYIKHIDDYFYTIFLEVHFVSKQRSFSRDEISIEGILYSFAHLRLEGFVVLICCLELDICFRYVDDMTLCSSL